MNISQTVFDTFVSSYRHALSAMLYKIRQGPADVADLERFSEAKRLADDALRDLRTANDRRNCPEEGDYIAEIGLES